MGVANFQHAKAWSEFWHDQEIGSSCLAGAPDIRRGLDDHWIALASVLPPGGRILDLGCGAGAAGRALLAANPELRVTGVDFAAVPPAADWRLEIVPLTAMERMPFDDASFDAAVSQFGFEYGDVDRAAQELARVLRPGAPFSFLVHHSQSRIAADCVPHQRALQSICGPTLKSAFLSGDGPVLGSELSAIRRLHPQERIVEQAAEGLVRHIGLPQPHRAAIWRAITAAIEPELVMLVQLQESWVSPERLMSWLEPLARRFALKPPAVVETASGKPLGWRIEGVKSGPGDVRPIQPPASRRR